MFYEMIFIFGFCVSTSSEEKDRNWVTKLQDEFTSPERNLLNKIDTSSEIIKVFVTLFDEDSFYSFVTTEPEDGCTKYTFHCTYNNYMSTVFSFLTDKDNVHKHKKVYFSYEGNRNKFLKVLHDTQRKLIDGCFENIEIFYSDNSHNVVEKCFYETNKVYLEVYDQEVSVITKNPNSNNLEISKTKLSDEVLLSFVKENYKDIVNVEDSTLKEFLAKYILTSKILSLDYEKIKENGRLLKDTKIEAAPSVLKHLQIVKIDFESLYLLFNFIKDSEFLENMIEKYFNESNEGEKDLLNEILYGMKAVIFESKAHFVIIDRITGKAMNGEKKDMSNSIAKVIRDRKINEKNVEKCKLFLLLTYSYFESVEKVEIDLVLRFIRENFFSEQVKKTNLKIFKKLSQCVAYIKNVETKNFVLDIYYVREEVELDRLLKK